MRSILIVGWVVLSASVYVKRLERLRYLIGLSSVLKRDLALDVSRFGVLRLSDGLE